MTESAPEPSSNSPTPTRRTDREAIRGGYNLTLYIVLGIIITSVLLPVLGSGITCATIDGSTFRSDTEMETYSSAHNEWSLSGGYEGII